MSRNYCFTSFGVGAPIWDEESLRYLVYQRELCPETKREHWQGYAECKKVMKIVGFKKCIGDAKAHCEVRRGTREQAREYCMKPESRIGLPVELGEWTKGQGHRSDLASACALGSTELVRLEFPTVYVRYHRGLEKLFENGAQRATKTEVEWYWGSTGTGKSRLAAEMVENRPCYWKPSGKWWDGYSGEECVVWDDFDKTSCGIGDLLRLCDRYPLRVEFKGGSRNFVSSLLVFTSHLHPREYAGERWSELERRIDCLVEK